MGCGQGRNERARWNALPSLAAPALRLLETCIWRAVHSREDPRPRLSLSPNCLAQTRLTLPPAHSDARRPRLVDRRPQGVEL